jgi:hypothetical protein
MGEEPDAIRDDIEQTRERMSETVAALGHKADVKTRAKERVQQTGERIGDVADGAIRRVREGVSGVTSSTGGAAGALKAQGRRGVGAAQQNPLGLVIGAAAAGFVLGTIIPSTQTEDEKFGAAGDRVREQAKELGREAVDRGKDVAGQAATAAVETAREQGKEQAEELKSSAQEKVEQTRSSSEG